MSSVERNKNKAREKSIGKTVLSEYLKYNIILFTGLLFWYDKNIFIFLVFMMCNTETSNVRHGIYTRCRVKRRVAWRSLIRFNFMAVLCVRVMRSY